MTASARAHPSVHYLQVHQGGSSGGHYYAYMRPDGKTWYKFDDERVTLEDGKAAMEGQFGAWVL